jgi:acetyl-CoA C-acetyltransferase
MTAPGSFAQLATAYGAKYRVPDEDLKRAMAQVSVKSHENGALNPKAHLRRPVSIEQVMAAPIIAFPLGLFDCCGVSDGSACAIVTTLEKALAMGKKNPIIVKALQLALSNGEEMGYNRWDGDHFMTTERCSRKAYEEAGIKNPRQGRSLERRSGRLLQPGR